MGRNALYRLLSGSGLYNITRTEKRYHEPDGYQKHTGKHLFLFFKKQKKSEQTVVDLNKFFSGLNNDRIRIGVSFLSSRPTAEVQNFTGRIQNFRFKDVYQ